MNLKKKHGELMLGLIILAFGIFYLSASRQILIKPSDALHSAVVPWILGGMILVLSLLQIWRGLSELRRIGADETPMGEGVDHKMVIVTILLLILYIAVLSLLGYIVSSVLYLFTMFVVWTPETEKKRFAFYATVALISGIGVYLAFRYGLDLMLPQGIIKFI